MSPLLLNDAPSRPANELPHPQPIAQIVRSLERALPALSDKYGIVSLGIFGSYLRGEATPESDLDVLVELGDGMPYRVREQLEQELSELVGVRVDLIPFESLGARPYLGRNVLRNLVWLQKDGLKENIEENFLITHLRNDNGDDIEPKREYMDLIQDMITSMQNAVDFSAQVEFSKLINDRMRMSALKYEIQTIGEAAGKIPVEIRELYPQIPWEKMIGMRNRLVHDYPNIDYSIMWEILHTDIPHDLMFVQDMFEGEKRRRQLPDFGNDEPTV